MSSILDTTTTTTTNTHKNDILGCGHTPSPLCIQQKCKLCCNSIKCYRHNDQFCVSCNIIVKSKNAVKHTNVIRCVDSKCVKCCKSLKCRRHKKYVKCSSCEKNNCNKNCISGNCNLCCEEKYCTVHLNKNNQCVLCTSSHKICINDCCSSCLCSDNPTCDVHFAYCINDVCDRRISTHTSCNLCNICCKNVDKCDDHYITDEHLEKKHVNDYKFALYSLGRSDKVIQNTINCSTNTPCFRLPIELINKISDEYLDTRTKCAVCKFALNSLEECFESNLAICCEKCNKIVCDTCCRFTTRYHYCIVEYYCDNCYEPTTPSLSQDSNDDDNGFDYIDYDSDDV